MSSLLAAGCCCDVCYRLAPRCPCSPEGPPVAVRCSDLEALLLLSESSTITFEHNEVCYYSSLDEDIVDPNATDPPLEIVIIGLRFPDCDACCCWKELTLCECSEGVPTKYARCNLAIGDVLKDQDGACYEVTGEVSELPPGAVIMVPVASYDSCEECCGPCEPGTCGCDVNFCPDILTFEVSNVTFTCPSCDPACCVPGAYSIPANANGGCLVLPGAVFDEITITCGSCDCPLTQQGAIDCDPSVSPPFYRFLASVAINPPAQFCIGGFCASCEHSLTMTWRSPILPECSCPPISGWELIFKSAQISSTPVLQLTKAA